MLSIVSKIQNRAKCGPVKAYALERNCFSKQKITFVIELSMENDEGNLWEFDLTLMYFSIELTKSYQILQFSAFGQSTTFLVP